MQKTVWFSSFEKWQMVEVFAGEWKNNEWTLNKHTQ